MDTDTDEKRSPLDNMHALYEWLTVWDKEVSTEKRSREDEPLTNHEAPRPRKRVVVPSRESMTNKKNKTYK